MNAHQRRIERRRILRAVEKANAISMEFINGIHDACSKPLNFSVYYDQDAKGAYMANLYFGELEPITVPLHLVLDSK
jgi:hypothetical protein